MVKTEELNRLDARKPVFRVCEQQMRRPACVSTQSDQRICYLLMENIISRLTTSEISIYWLVSVAEETGLSLALSKIPKTGFVASRPINKENGNKLKDDNGSERKIM